MTRLNFQASCPDCGLTSADVGILNNHSCDVERAGGYCEDFPACGHERGDCNGLRYGSDASIIADVERAFYDEAFAERMELQAEYDDMWR